MRTLSVFCCLASGLVVLPVYAQDSSAESRLVAERFFETKIRPALAEHCYKCHGDGKHKGGLQADSLEGLLQGGDSGPAITPGHPAESLLLQAISYADDAPVQMPPTGKLPEAVIADFKTWIAQGAVWPGADPSKIALKKRDEPTITDEDRSYWAFRPIERPLPPDGWQGHPIDGFIAGQLQKKGLKPNGRAEKRELIRRVFFDLIGLPPTPEEVAAFLADDSAEAWPRLIDNLLARPQYGERWARHWLDLVRFAQSNGYERDGEKANAWQYRDYVIRALNADKPYDQFVVEQLAGDELRPLTNDGIAATGFYRLAVWDDEPDDRRMAEFDELDDILAVTGTTFLGMTLGCARCHDHMFDPIPQKDYYSLLAFVRNVKLHSNEVSLDSASQALVGDRDVIAKWSQETREKADALKQQIHAAEGEERKKLERELRELITRAPEGASWALSVSDRGVEAPKTHLLTRGNASTPADEVEPAFLSVISEQAPAIAPPDDGTSSGRRLALARWIASPENPLTARVMVNRVWQHHFGNGIVKTTTDFGQAGLPPTHPELLDWLASEFLANGWSIKSLHRTILLSESYQRSSRVGENPQAEGADPANDLLWRQNLRRLEAEAIRDTILTLAGRLNPQMAGRGFFPRLAGEVLAGGSRPGEGWQIMRGADEWRRSIYTFTKRSMMVPAMELFDYANNAQPLGERPTTTVAPQALMLLNDRFLIDQAEGWATRLKAEAGPDLEAQVQLAYQLALSRPASPNEVQIARQFVSRQTETYLALRSRLTFVPDVPLSLHQSYQRQMQPTDYLLGPAAGWQYYPGRWVGGYEGIKGVELDYTPFALWPGVAWKDGRCTTELTLSSATEFTGLIVRGQAVKDVFTGYEVLLNPRIPSLSLRRVGETVTLLAEARHPIPANRPLPVRVEAVGSRIRVWLDQQSEPLIDVTDADPLLQEGFVGVRVWGAPVSLDHLTIAAGTASYEIAQLVAGDRAMPVAESVLQGWKSYGGNWSLPASDQLSVQPSAGAKILWQGDDLANGTVSAEIQLNEGQDVGLLVRATEVSSGVDALRAYNINLTHKELRLGRHDQNWRPLATAPLNLRPDEWCHIQVQLEGPRIQITLNHSSQPQIEFVDPDPLPAGKVGFRTYQAKAKFRNLTLQNGEAGQSVAAKSIPLLPVAATPAVNILPGDPRPDPAHQALAAYCLALFNLSELIYVD